MVRLGTIILLVPLDCLCLTRIIFDCFTLLISFLLTAECGDFVAEDYPDPTYLSTYKFVPHQDRELERRIMENHKKHS